MRLFLTALILCFSCTFAQAGVILDSSKKYPDTYTTGPNNKNLTTLRCPGAKIALDYDIPSPGGAVGDDFILLNPKYMKDMAWEARLFMFAHECGHLSIGDDESEADHFAVKKGVKEGWLTKEMLKPICEDYGDQPADDVHPSGRTRCMQNERWFAEETEAKNAPIVVPEVKVEAPVPAPITFPDKSVPSQWGAWIRSWF